MGRQIVKIVTLSEDEALTLKCLNVAFDKAETDLRGYEQQLKNKYQPPAKHNGIEYRYPVHTFGPDFGHVIYEL